MIVRSVGPDGYYQDNGAADDDGNTRRSSVVFQLVVLVHLIDAKHLIIIMLDRTSRPCRHIPRRKCILSYFLIIQFIIWFD